MVHRGECHGPAAARNRGAQFARGEYLFFLDSDVCVYPETLQELIDSFTREPDVDAVFGSYDSQPSAENVLSQYKNLFHHFVHQDSHEQATTFWSGCGGIRRSVFLKMGGFSGSYKRPSIEDIELGIRLHTAGHRIMLNKRIEVTHLKSLDSLEHHQDRRVRSGHPLDRLMLREGSMPNDLNTKISQRISVVLAYGLLLTLGIGVWHYRHLLWVPLFLLVLISALDYWSVKRRFPDGRSTSGGPRRPGNSGDGRLHLQGMAAAVVGPARRDRRHQFPLLCVLLDQGSPAVDAAPASDARALLPLLRAGVWPGSHPPRAEAPFRQHDEGVGSAPANWAAVTLVWSHVRGVR